nr:protein NLRC5-like [Lytechinus pictus]
MPRCKAAVTLQHLCIGNITTNVRYWTQDYEDKLLDKGRFRHLLGPFDEIPSSMLIQDLADELIRRRKLTRSSLHLLINGGLLQHLDFSDCPRLITDEIVYMIADKCKKVKTLILSGCSRVSSQAFEILANNIPFAVRLDFSNTKIGTLAIQSLFRSCSDLQELALRHCQVCDNDVGVLCNMAMQKERFGLRKLDLSSSMVTDMGIRALLRSIPQLQEFHYSNLIGCIIAESPITEEFEHQYLLQLPHLGQESSLFSSSAVDTKMGQTSLRMLECTDFCNITDSHLKLISFLCPKLVSLDLRFARGFSSAGLTDLLHLLHLKELKLASSDLLSFEGALLAFLRRNGNQLTLLSLEDFDGIDLHLVGQLCPHLQKLLIFMTSDNADFTSGEYGNLSTQTPFKHLEELALWCSNANSTITPDILNTVLPHCLSLRSLEVIRVAGLTDSVLHEAIDSHCFLKLKSLTLHECNAVSRAPISRLILDDRNILETLTLMDCFSTTRRDYEGWLKLVKRRNYKLTIAWK